MTIPLLFYFEYDNDDEKKNIRTLFVPACVREQWSEYMKEILVFKTGLAVGGILLTGSSESLYYI